jgi:RNA polymerase sigma-70 factor (ECF subfamily)
MSSHQIVRALPLTANVNSGDRLAALFDAHHNRLYRLARRLTASPDDALDLVQETFLRIAHSPSTIPSGPPDEEAWLVRVLVNIRRDQWRKAAVRDRYKALSTSSHAQPVALRSEEAALIARTAVWQALDTLPPRRRTIVVLHEIEELSVRAIASLLGINAITVRWHLAVARRDLTSILKPYLGDNHDA